MFGIKIKIKVSSIRCTNKLKTLLCADNFICRETKWCIIFIFSLAFLLGPLSPWRSQRQCYDFSDKTRQRDSRSSRTVQLEIKNTSLRFSGNKIVSWKLLLMFVKPSDRRHFYLYFDTKHAGVDTKIYRLLWKCKSRLSKKRVLISSIFRLKTSKFQKRDFLQNRGGHQSVGKYVKNRYTIWLVVCIASFRDLPFYLQVVRQQ